MIAFSDDDFYYKDYGYILLIREFDSLKIKWRNEF